MNPNDTAEMCPACLNRLWDFEEQYRDQFIVGEIVNGKCNRCTYTQNRKGDDDNDNVSETGEGVSRD